MEKKEKFIVPVFKALVAHIEVEAESMEEAAELAFYACNHRQVPDSAFRGLMADMTTSPFDIEPNIPIVRSEPGARKTYSMIDGPLSVADGETPVGLGDLAAMELFEALRSVDIFAANITVPGLVDAPFDALDAQDEATTAYLDYIEDPGDGWMNWDERPESIRVQRGPVEPKPGM